jgi:RNA polymerase sigma factor (sigma-70 family)
MRMEISLEELVEQALGGSADAVETLVHAIQDDIYRLALRMLWHPHDAADATQEILIKIVTRLDSFRGESAFRTWCFRVASNHLLTIRASRAEQRAISFESLGEKLAADPHGPEPRTPETPEDLLLEQEVKLGCTLGILLCLDRPHRLAYIVGEILDLSGDEGAEIAGVEPATYRKRLSRARTRMREFMEQRCGIVSPAAPCRCSRKLSPAIEAGRINPEQLLFAVHEERPLDARSLLPKVREMEELHATVQLYRSHPDYAAPATLARSIRELLSARSPSLLSD